MQKWITCIADSSQNQQQQTESVLSNAANKMREKLAALEDLNELLEEPVEEQVSYIFLFFFKLRFSKKAKKIWKNLPLSFDIA